LAPKQYNPVFVRSEDERSGGSSNFIRLEEGKRFSGYPLFDADPKVEDPAYQEYLEHYHVASRRSVPCAGPDDCILCQDGDRPKTRALTVWAVTRDETAKELNPPELRVFTFNWNLVKMFTEFRAEGDKFKGKEFRVSLLDDRGNYGLMTKESKSLTKTEISTYLKSKEAPNLQDIIVSRLRRAMEGLAVARALDDDDPDAKNEEPPKTQAKAKGKAAPDPEPEPEPDATWPASVEELLVAVSEVSQENFVLVDHADYGEGEKVWGTTDVDLTVLEAGDVIAVDYFTDEDDDKVATAFEKQEAPEAPPEEAAVDLPDKISGEEFEVVGPVDESNGTVPVRNEDLGLEFTLWFLQTVALDSDELTEGTKIIVDAEKDTMGDMVMTTAPKIVTAKATAAKGAGAKKTTARKGA
jgi:hypothetical protein